MQYLEHISYKTMSNCTPCTPANDELPIFCDPFPATDTAKRLLVEDEAFCQKALTTANQQALKTDSNGNINWTNGGNNTVLCKDSTGKVEFAKITTDQIADGTILNSNINSSAAIDGTKINPNFGSQDIKTSGVLYIENDSSANSVISSAGTGISYLQFRKSRGTQASPALVQNGDQIGSLVFYGYDGTGINVGSIISASVDGTPAVGKIPTAINFSTRNDANNYASRFFIDGAVGNVGINTTSPAKTLHVNGTVRLQGLPTYANNAAAITGGLVADDVYKTATGELRIVV